ADDHLCFWLPDARTVFAGDLVAGVGTVVLGESPGALDRYLASLEKLLALGDFTLLPGHGPALADGAAKVREYLAHRTMREVQIVEALLTGESTVEARIGKGTEVAVRLEEGRVVASPVAAIPTLDELLAGVTPENLHGEAWPDKVAVGREKLNRWQ